MVLPSVSRPAFLLLFSLPPIRGVIHQARSTSIFLTRQPDNAIPSPLPPEFARSYSTQLTSSNRAESTTFWHRDHVRGQRSCIRLLDQRLLPEPPACADGRSRAQKCLVESIFKFVYDFPHASHRKCLLSYDQAAERHQNLRKRMTGNLKSTV